MRAVYLFLVLTLGHIAVLPQTTIPNGDLEEWTHVPGSGSFKDYDEPSNGWSSGNGAIHVAPGADPVCEQTDDAAVGQYAAKLTTRRIFGQIASGSLFIGRFELNLANPKESARLGMPCTEVPRMFRGMYKYLPQGGDSAVIRATFRRWNNGQREIVSEAKLTVKVTVDAWTPFELLIPDPTAAPDTVEVVFASSAGGEFFKGDVGSALFIDNVRFDTQASVEIHKGDRNMMLGQWRSASSVLHVNDLLVGKAYQVVDLNGSVLEEGICTHDLNLSHLAPGAYGVRVPGITTLMFIK